MGELTLEEEGAREDDRLSNDPPLPGTTQVPGLPPSSFQARTASRCLASSPLPSSAACWIASRYRQSMMRSSP